MVNIMNRNKIEVEELLEKAISRIACLEKENCRLKNLLSQQKSDEIPTPDIPIKKSSIDNHSVPEIKVALFTSLFKGRVDVFAKIW